MILNDTINVLGTLYSVIETTETKDERLVGNSGVCDHTSKEILLETEYHDADVRNLDAYKRKVLRHEIVHAFLIESGLCENTFLPPDEPWAMSETIVDWIAIQGEKIYECWRGVGAV